MQSRISFVKVSEQYNNKAHEATFLFVKGELNPDF